MKKYLLTSSLLVLLLSSCGSSKFDAEYYKGKLTIDTSSLVSSSGSNKIINASGEQEVSFNSTYYTNGFYYKVTSGDAVSEVTTLLVDGKVRFACIDGPEFDGTKVDYDEAIKRNKMYFKEEREKDCNLLRKIDE